MGDYTYLFLNVITISFPLIRSFESRINYYGKWKHLFPAIAITGAFFIIWDVIFTYWGVWGFNPAYLTGIDIINLPLEEWLFFICIPYACVFIYMAYRYFVNRDFLKSSTRYITIVLTIGCLLMAVLNFQRDYTFSTFLFLGIFLLLHLTVFKSNYLGYFYVSYLIILIPFFIINGVLTGTWIPDQVVWYNDAENLGIRMGTIPVEDTFYGMLLILMNVTIYEWLAGRAQKS